MKFYDDDTFLQIDGKMLKVNQTSNKRFNISKNKIKPMKSFRLPYNSISTFDAQHMFRS